jgi:leader peptidase (prepilin peptidase) / N-methyltransferase
MTPRHAIVGLVAAGLAAAVLVRFGLTARGLIEAFVVAVLVWLSAIDIERHVLPNAIVLPAAALVLVAQIVAFPDHAIEWIVSAVAAAGVLLLFVIVYPAGMGMGDVKLALLLGAALGRLVVVALLIGFVAAALAGLVLIARRGLGARKQGIPLGPFLAFGATVTLFLGTPGHS